MVKGTSDNLGSFIAVTKTEQSDLYSWTLEEMTDTKSPATEEGQKAAWQSEQLNKQEPKKLCKVTGYNITIQKSVVVFVYQQGKTPK